MEEDNRKIGEIRISVRNLVEFILRHGDIDNRRQASSADNAMQEGSRIHRMLQRRMGAEYQAEVPLSFTLLTEDYRLVVEGRADGIIHHEGQVVIDEIKGTYRELHRLKEPERLHLAQAKCYAYLCALKEELTEINVRMTYCNITTEELRYFYFDYSFEELSDWFGELIASYRKWADDAWRWRGIRQASIEGLGFPFAYREGQKELVTNVYSTIYHKRKLFLEAPTGVGKTISTIYPAVCAMGKGMGEKLFYLTAKTITRTVAAETLDILRREGLKFRSVILTAKEKICFMEETECNPEACPYAKGHYDRINDAVYDLLTSEEDFTRERIEEYAKKHRVCPFEMCLDVSLFADGIICDYNYLFDPHIYLKRFFSESGEGNYIFLVDEAHNLLERGREMYSAVLRKEQFSDMAAALEEAAGSKSVLVRNGYAKKLISQLGKCGRAMLELKRECEQWRIVDEIEKLAKPLLRLQGVMDDYLSEQEEENLPVREELLDFYFEVSHFLEMYELMDENYVIYTQMCDDGGFFVKLFCVNPAENLKNCMARGRSTILFSATFLPIQYYKRLLGGEEQDYEVYAKSVFSTEKRGLFIAGDVTSRYNRRSEEEYYNIACYVEEIVKNRHGNYLVFCPSYAFLHRIYEQYTEHFAGADRECILQSEYMSEADREDFLARFKGNEELDLQAGICMEIEEEDTALIGFCVMGGIFGEGIDLKNDGLIGAIIVGTGLPQVCNEREILKLYFDETDGCGFDYAYRYPGMNKVLQAAGRVIRTVDDVGIVALLDDRFLQRPYRKMFPREWEDFETVTLNTVGKRVAKFWDEWL